MEPRKDNKIIISGNYDRKSLIKHAVILMQKALDISTGFSVVVDADIDLRHCGLGSSASAIQGVGVAISELYNNLIKSMDLIRYLAGNRTEEIDGDDDDIAFIFLSTAGPGFCMITKNTEKAKSIFESLNMKTFVADIHNSRYEVIKKTR